jgi:RNA polymerase sigma factor (TIGR02999 family)
MNAAATPPNDDLQALVKILHAELRRAAHRERYKLGSPGTLQTTALINEVYLKLVGKGEWRDRAHFLNVAAMAMRQVLVSYAREGLAQKRGAGAVEASFDDRDDANDDADAEDIDAHNVLAESDEHILALEQALTNLEKHEPRLARVVECRYFAGYTMQETAAALGIAERTVERDMTRAKALIYQALGVG